MGFICEMRFIIRRFGLLALEYEGVRKFTSFKIGKML